jgi:UDP-N-acetylmuramate--alanine ligase
VTVDLRLHHHVHLVGIAGARMSALARYLLSTGHIVSGSDRYPGEPGSALARLGVRIDTGHDQRYVDGADLLVVTPAAGDDNPEVQAALKRGITVIKGSQLLAEIMNAGRGIAVAGTHGKSTTSALIGHILTVAGLDPTVLIGGVSVNIGSNARLGGGDIVVVEADEYDASFLYLRPAIAVVTNVAPEHMDYYGTFENLRDAFREFAAAALECLLVCADEPGLLDLVRDINVPTITYGLQAADWRAFDVVETGTDTEFRVVGAQMDRRLRTRLAGAHMVKNTLAAIAVANYVGAPFDAIDEAVASFSGVARRMERKGKASGVVVFDDYAVHPTEIRATLAAIKGRYGRPLKVIFQSHTYSRTKAFLDDFARSFDDADAVYIMEIYAARETDDLGVDGRVLAEAIQMHHPRVRFSDTADATIDAVCRAARTGDIVVTMGAGTVTELGPRILKALDES